nr:30S ribosomal protein S6e [Nanoarchaeota archaeon]
MEFKINIGDPKTGKTVKRVVSGKEAEAFFKKRIGEKINGDDIGFAGYEFEISGGSDYCGFPMRKDVRGTARKRILIVSGVGIRKNRRGRKVRKTVAGNTIYSKTAQINLKIIKKGSKPLAEEKKEEEEPAKEKKEEKPKEKKEVKKEKKPEAKEKKKPEKAEAKKKKPKEEKKEESKN